MTDEKDSKKARTEDAQPSKENDATVAEKPQSLIFQLWNKWKRSNDAASKQDVQPLPSTESEQTLAPEPDAPKEEQPEEPEEDPQDLEQNTDDTLSPENEPKEELEVAPEEMPEPVDATVTVEITADKLKASITVLPPEYGGTDIIKEQIEDALAASNIVFGIAQETIDYLSRKKIYGKTFVVAQGVDAVDGTHEIVKELFERERTLHLSTKEDGSIDFKEMNLLVTVEKGQTICNIIPAVPPVPGTTVHGASIPGFEGRKAPIPQGKNVERNEDGTKLVAACTGSLSFKKDKFEVDPVLQIPGHINNSTGNINFSGDVVVLGDVFEGYEVRSEGNVTIKGMVAGGSVYAKGNIVVVGGMNGSNRGELVSEKAIRSKFLENCVVRAKETITAESVLNSDVYCSDSLMVTAGKGALIGGTHTVFRTVEAKIIGTRSNTPTTIIMGATPDLLAEKEGLEEELRKLKEETDKVLKGIAYLTGLQKKQELSEDRAALLKKFKRDKPIQMLKKSKLDREIEALNSSLEDVASCRVKAGIVYFPTKVTIGTATYFVQQENKRCHFYISEGEVVLGTY